MKLVRDADGGARACRGLSALNIDPEQAAHAYRERVVGPYRGVLPAAAVASMEEQLSGACTVEIAAFDEFSKLLGDAEATRRRSTTSSSTRRPPGHTLRLLELPAAWSSFIETNVGGTSCLGPLSGLDGAAGAVRRLERGAARSRRRRRSCWSRGPSASSLDRGGAHARRARAARRRRTSGSILNGVFRAARRERRHRRRHGGARARVARGACPPGLRGASRASTCRCCRSGSSASRRCARWATHTGGERRPRRSPRARFAASSLDALVEELADARQGRRHDDGQGRRRQDDGGGAHRRRSSRAAGYRGHAHDDRSRRPRRGRPLGERPPQRCA